MKRKFLSNLSILGLMTIIVSFIACNNGTNSNSNNKPSEDSSSSDNIGQIMGFVLDNRCEPVDNAKITFGNKQRKSDSKGVFIFDEISINDTDVAIATDTINTTFTVTAEKEGYLYATIPVIFVSYKKMETTGATAYLQDLINLYTTYADLLNVYTTTVSNTDVTITGQITDAIPSKVSPIYTNDDEVFLSLINAITSIEYKFRIAEFHKYFLSTLPYSTMIPLDASLSGQVRLCLITDYLVGRYEFCTTTSYPPIHVTYQPTNDSNANYSWTTTVDINGNFSFSKLPSGVSVSISIDPFLEHLNGTPYVFSSESSNLVIENSQAGTTMSATQNTIALDAINGQKSVVYWLFAQRFN